MMRAKFYIMIWLLFTVAVGGCKENDLASDSPELDLTKVAAVSLSTISLQDDVTSTRAGAETPMAVGETFRLYAFAKGQTDISKLLVTRAYVIASVAGSPQLMAGEKTLYLPVGDVDIYLVGPLKKDINAGENALLPEEERTVNEVEVATASGVYPHYGVDLITSKTELKIVAGTVNKFKANPLRHKMARMDVRVSRPEKPTYENLLLKEIQVYNQALQSEFTFGEEGGSIKSTSGDATITTHCFIEEMRGDSYRSTLYMIPRPEQELKLEVRFVCNHIGQTSLIDKRLSSGLITAPLIAGEQNLFWSKPELSPTILWRWKLLPWNDVDQGAVSVPQYGELIFSYSGLDAPMEIDGKKYWRDRSGNGYHAEIDGEMIYDPINKCYSNSANGTSQFIIPALGKVGDYTIEFAVESAHSPRSQAAYFSDNKMVGNRCLNIHLPYDNNTAYFDTGDMEARRTLYVYSSNDLNLMENFSTYYFSRSTIYQAMGRNGKEYRYQNISANNSYGAFNYNKLWYSFSTDVEKYRQARSKMKLYAVRMYKGYTGGTQATSLQVKNYEADLSTFMGINAKGADTEYVKDGLILNLDGEKRGSNNTQWTDISGNNNHATIKGSVPFNSGDADHWGYSFSLNAANYMKLTRSLGTHQDFTIEFVASTPDVTGDEGTSIFSFRPFATGGQRTFHVHYPWLKGSATVHDGIFIDCPYSIPGLSTVRLNFPIWYTNTLPYSIKKVSQWSITREGGKPDGFIAYMNTRKQGSGSALDKLPEMRECFIGVDGTSYPFRGYISAIRVYNRKLTDKERQHNYLVDQKKYSIISAMLLNP